jgi:gamma-glutamylcyclotransferase (GGCT)/AIG2-like uncharacterized protein YtfP
VDDAVRLRPRPLSPRDFDELLELNRLRSAGASARRQELEARFAADFGVDRRLAVYGSLAPGESNHGQLSGLTGLWLTGLSVRGERRPHGWGAALGFPALRWSPDGPSVAVQLFASDELPGQWDRLDRFEGPEYARIVVPLYEGERPAGLANLYAARE